MFFANYIIQKSFDFTYKVEAFMGSFKAFTYNVFAGLFGNSLKQRYNPYDEDRMIERVAILVEQGAI